MAFARAIVRHLAAGALAFAAIGIGGLALGQSADNSAFFDFEDASAVDPAMRAVQITDQYRDRGVVFADAWARATRVFEPQTLGPRTTHVLIACQVVQGCARQTAMTFERPVQRVQFRAGLVTVEPTRGTLRVAALDREGKPRPFDFQIEGSRAQRLDTNVDAVARGEPIVSIIVGYVPGNAPVPEDGSLPAAQTSVAVAIDDIRVEFAPDLEPAIVLEPGGLMDTTDIGGAELPSFEPLPAIPPYVEVVVIREVPVDPFAGLPAFLLAAGVAGAAAGAHAWQQARAKLRARITTRVVAGARATRQLSPTGEETHAEVTVPDINYNVDIWAVPHKFELFPKGVGEEDT